MLNKTFFFSSVDSSSIASVYLSGDFNQWNTQTHRMTKAPGGWRIDVDCYFFSHNRCKFKFIIVSQDGESNWLPLAFGDHLTFPLHHYLIVFIPCLEADKDIFIASDENSWLRAIGGQIFPQLSQEKLAHTLDVGYLSSQPFPNEFKLVEQAERGCRWWPENNIFLNSAGVGLSPHVSSGDTGVHISNRDYLEANMFASKYSDALPDRWEKITLIYKTSMLRAFQPILLHKVGSSTFMLVFSCTQQFLSHWLADAKLYFKLRPDILNYFSKLYGAILDKIPVSHNLCVSGYSLGATLAEVYAARFRLRAVTFEGTGSQETVNADSKYFDYTPDTSQITCYLTAPNPINMLQPHVGRLFRLYVPHSRVERSASIKMLSSLSDSAPDFFVTQLFKFISKCEYVFACVVWMLKLDCNWIQNQHDLRSIMLLIDSNGSDFGYFNSDYKSSWPLFRVESSFPRDWYKKVNEEFKVHRKSGKSSAFFAEQVVIRTMPGYDNTSGSHKFSQ